MAALPSPPCAMLFDPLAIEWCNTISDQTISPHFVINNLIKYNNTNIDRQIIKVKNAYRASSKSAIRSCTILAALIHLNFNGNYMFLPTYNVISLYLKSQRQPT